MCPFVRGDKPSRLHISLIVPATRVLSWLGMNPPNPPPNCSLSDTRNSQSNVFQKLMTSPTVTTVPLTGRFDPGSAVPPLAVVPGDVNVPVRYDPSTGSDFPYFSEGL